MTRLEELRAKYAEPMTLDPYPWVRITGIRSWKKLYDRCRFEPRPQYEQRREMYP